MGPISFGLRHEHLPTVLGFTRVENFSIAMCSWRWHDQANARDDHRQRCLDLLDKELAILLANPAKKGLFLGINASRIWVPEV